MRMLETMADLSMRLACRVAEAELGASESGEATSAAAAGPPGKPPGPRDPSLAFCRYTKAMRQCILLAATLDADRKRGSPAEPDRAGRAASRKKRNIRRLLESSITTEGDADDREDLVREAVERLDAMAIEADDPRPIGLIVEEICRALGIAFNCKQMTDEEIGMNWPGWAEMYPEMDAARAEPPGAGRAAAAPGASAGGCDSRRGAGGEPGTEAPEGRQGMPPAASPRRAASGLAEPAPFSLADQVLRDCGLAVHEGETTADIDPFPD